MYNQMKVLIIHSQQTKSNDIQNYLQTQNYICDQVVHYQQLEDVSFHHYDCIIIEDEFPKIKIEEFIPQIKLTSQNIIIVISDSLSSVYLDSLLNAGADDYITTPYQLKDFDMKIQSIYKNGILKPRSIYRFKDLILDATSNICLCNQKPVHLTKNEFKLLSLLISHPYQPFSMTYLFENIWGSSTYEDGTSIPALAESIMNKLKVINPNQEYIKKFGKDFYKMAF